MAKWIIVIQLVLLFAPACERVVEEQVVEPTVAPPLPAVPIPEAEAASPEAAPDDRDGWSSSAWRRVFGGRAGILEGGSTYQFKHPHPCQVLLDSDNDGNADRITVSELNAIGLPRSSSVQIPTAPTPVPDLPEGVPEIHEPLRIELEELDQDADGSPDAVVRNVYDGDDNRVSMETLDFFTSEPTASSYFVYDEKGNLLGEFRLDLEGHINARTFMSYDCAE